jgi:uncharacterized protein YidB (DUF937 family)
MTPVRAVLDRVLAEGTVVAASDGSVHQVFPVAIAAAEGEALRSWVVREKANRTIEVGPGSYTPLTLPTKRIV